VSSIQAGLFFGSLAAIREITRQLKAECFPSEEAVVIGTGGFSRLFAGEGVFDELAPDLVLRGLAIALRSSLQAS
jgi:type III pantothenate kinase